LVGFGVLQQQINLIRRFFSNPQTPDSGITPKVAVEVLESRIDQLYEITFGSDSHEPFFDPYIASFCSHDGDDLEYERENGLLSQWRG
jgi:hypothetical protein